jgi:serine-type D-Ala-D-Ala carboxypeptidase/endopeptidase (penicillin-binding protein 4)
MSRWYCSIILVTAALAASAGEPLSLRIDGVIESAPAAQQAFWGIRIVNLADGSIVYEKNANRFFVPASNTKLFSTALALTRLGPSYRFTTKVLAGSEPVNGILRGDLRLVGGGDPNLSARVLPYKKDAVTDNPLQKLEDLADQIVARGVTVIDGNIVGDDTAYPWEPYPNGWAANDSISDDGAPVSALTLNDNAFKITIGPGANAGDPATLTLVPALEPLTIQNRVLTTNGNDRKVHFERLSNSHELIITGTMPIAAVPYVTTLAVDDPALYAAKALLDALEKRGVVVKGAALSMHRQAAEAPVAEEGIELAKHLSEPLLEVLQVVDKESQNLHAELMLRTVARERTGDGSLENGIKEMKAFLSSIGVDQKQYRFEDGSGLSRLTLLTPLTISKLLLYMYNSPYRDAWPALLPIAGEDGTLSRRFVNTRAAGVVHAKTGSLSHVTALSGYILPKSGRRYAFAITVNNFNADATSIRRTLDKIILLLVSPK